MDRNLGIESIAAPVAVPAPPGAGQTQGEPRRTRRRNHRQWISVAGFGLIVAGFLVFGLGPYLRDLRRLRADLARRAAVVAENSTASTQLKDLTRKVHLIKLAVQDYEDLVPASLDLGPFLGQLSAELDAVKMRDVSVRALAATKLGRCQQLPIEVHGIGTFAQVHDFLTRLERLRRRSSVSKLNIEADAALSGTVTMDLTLSIYSIRP